MLNLRKSCFETNSSSTHSITISNRTKDILEPCNLPQYVKDSKFVIKLFNYDDFHNSDQFNNSEDFEIIACSQYDRVAYIATAIFENLCYKTNKSYEELSNSYGNYQELTEFETLIKELSGATEIVFKGSDDLGLPGDGNDLDEIQEIGYKNFILKNYVCYQQSW